MDIVHAITTLYCIIDDAMPEEKQHPQAKLSISELTTIGALFALKRLSQRDFCNWLASNHSDMFPNLPERTRLFRRLARRRGAAETFLARPDAIAVMDSFGIETLHPYREKRRRPRIGGKGLSNHRWIFGFSLCAAVSEDWQVVAWDCDTANVHDSRFHRLAAALGDDAEVLADFGFHAAAGDPANLTICRRGERNERMRVETVFSMLARRFGLKKVCHRTMEGLLSRLSYTIAAFNLGLRMGGGRSLSHIVL